MTLLISCVVNGLLSLILIPKLGIHGAAMASSVSHVVLLGMLMGVMVMKLAERSRTTAVETKNRRGSGAGRGGDPAAVVWPGGVRSAEGCKGLPVISGVKE